MNAKAVNLKNTCMLIQSFIEKAVLMVFDCNGNVISKINSVGILEIVRYTKMV